MEMSRKKRRRRRLLLIVPLLVLTGLVLLVELHLSPYIRELARNQAVNAASNAIIEAVSEMLRRGDTDFSRVIVLEKTFAVGIGGILATDVRTSLASLLINCYTVVAGLGGRPITKKSLHELFEKGCRDELPALTFLDLDWAVVNKQLERERQKRRSGPTAENILRDVAHIS